MVRHSWRYFAKFTCFKFEEEKEKKIKKKNRIWGVALATAAFGLRSAVLSFAAISPY